MGEIPREVREIKNYQVNERIFASKVRVIDEMGAQLGILDKSEALRMARERGYDLVLVSTGSDVPVCKIADFGKMKYEMVKQEKDAKKKQKSGTLKELKLSVKIGEHDYQVVLTKSIDFLTKGHKVKVSLRFKGREITHPDLGRKIMLRLVTDTLNAGFAELPPKLDGKNLFMTLAPKKT